MKRIYEDEVLTHFNSGGREAIFLTGPRQVGKTTVAEHLQSHYENSVYLNWDDMQDRQQILSMDIPLINNKYLKAPLIIFDEIHKFSDWKQYLKGTFDKHKKNVDFIVTGSCRLDVYRKGGDSMMGRYFLYRVHPLSVAELLGQNSDQEYSMPKSIDTDQFEALIKYGGFPRPFLAADDRIYNRWVNQRFERLVQEDIRDVTAIHDLSKLESLAVLLANQSGQLVNFTSLAKQVWVSDQTIRNWISTLSQFYYCFSIQPWFENISRSLIKNPKIYMYDWSVVKDKGQRSENFIASHLLKAVHFWTDRGLGQYRLHFIRDKDQREVDFLVSKNGEPWMLVEVKSSAKSELSPSLIHFKEKLGAPYAFQVAMDAAYIEKNCFDSTEATIVPAKTFLSQLI